MANDQMGPEAAIVLSLTAQVDRLLPLVLGVVESDGAEPRVEGNPRIDSNTAAETCAQDLLQTKTNVRDPDDDLFSSFELQEGWRER